MKQEWFENERLVGKKQTIICEHKSSNFYWNSMCQKIANFSYNKLAKVLHILKGQLTWPFILLALGYFYPSLSLLAIIDSR